MAATTSALRAAVVRALGFASGFMSELLTSLCGGIAGGSATVRKGSLPGELCQLLALPAYKPFFMTELRINSQLRLTIRAAATR